MASSQTDETRERAFSVLVTGPVPTSGSPHASLALHETAGRDEAVVLSEVGGGIRAIAAAGPRKIDADLIASLPNLEIIANFGVGYDRVDVVAASRAGVVVTNTPDVLTEEVADLTLGLMIAAVRRIPQADRYVREGRWASKGFPLSPSLRGRTVGIVGLGRIGKAVARRCSAMDLPVAYHARSRKEEVDYAYHASIGDLARAVDVLVVTVPGGAETRNLIDKTVLRELGPDGVLVNVARGSVVDEAALVEALKSGAILAAGLDVFLEEPNVPQALLEADNVVLLPHVGSATTVTRQAMGDLVFANIRSWFEKGEALTPVN